MKDKIVEILNNRFAEVPEEDIAEETLDLLKQEGWKSPEDIPDCEICLEKNEEAMRDKGWKPPLNENDFEAVADECSEQFAKAMRAKGWLHKEDPVKGLKVKMKCPECDGKGEYVHNGFMGIFDTDGQPVIEEQLQGLTVPCTLCNNGVYERPLTVGEALDMVEGMFNTLSSISTYDDTNPDYQYLSDCMILAKLVSKNALFTKDGGRIVREE